MIYLVLLLIIIFLLIIYFKKDNIENFDSQVTFKDYSQNVLNRNRLLDGQKEFDVNYKHLITINNDFFNANTEINNKQFQNILNHLKNKKSINTKFTEPQKYKFKYYNQEKIPQINNEIYNLVKKKIIQDINDIIKNTKFGENRTFQIINDTIIEYRENKKYIKIIFILNIYRVYKFHGYQIFFITYYNKKNRQIYIQNIEIMGNIHEQEISILPGYQDNNQNLQIYYSCFPYTRYDASKTYVRYSQNDKVLPNKKQINNILENRSRDRLQYFVDRSYSCYGSEGDDYYNCISNKNIMNTYKPRGIWDRPCFYNEECPFYKANKNYQNNRGGCINGFCEMPLNVQSLTYRNYNIKTKPLCHNCKEKSDQCCDYQMKENPKLLSPDYAFIGDKVERYIHRNQLKKKGLKIYNPN